VDEARIRSRALRAEIAAELHDVEEGIDPPRAGQLQLGADPLEVGDGQPRPRHRGIAHAVQVQREDQNLEPPRLGHHLVQDQVVGKERAHGSFMPPGAGHEIRLIAKSADPLPLRSRATACEERVMPAQIEILGQFSLHSYCRKPPKNRQLVRQLPIHTKKGRTLFRAIDYGRGQRTRAVASTERPARNAPTKGPPAAVRSASIRPTRLH